MQQFYILFYANYTILATQRGGPWPNGPPKYAPERAIKYKGVIIWNNIPSDVTKNTFQQFKSN